MFDEQMQVVDGAVRLDRLGRPPCVGRGWGGPDVLISHAPPTALGAAVPDPGPRSRCGLLLLVAAEVLRKNLAVLPVASSGISCECVYILGHGVGLSLSCVTTGNPLNFSNPDSSSGKWNYSGALWCGRLNGTVCGEQLAWRRCLAHSGPQHLLND